MIKLTYRSDESFGAARKEKEVRSSSKPPEELERTNLEKRNNRSLTIWIVLGLILLLMIIGSLSEENNKTTKSEVIRSQQQVSGTIKFVNSPNGLRLRAHPSLSAEVLSVLKDKTKVEVLREQKEWSEVKVKKGTGWVASRYLSQKEEVVYKDTRVKSQIENIVKKTNRTARVEVTKNGNKYNVFIVFPASDNAFGDKYIKIGIQEDMTELYKVLFNSGLPISVVRIGAVFPVIDRYGNESNDIVYATELRETEAKRVNWSQDAGFLAIQIMPRVWTILKSLF